MSFLLPISPTNAVVDTVGTVSSMVPSVTLTLSFETTSLMSETSCRPELPSQRSSRTVYVSQGSAPSESSASVVLPSPHAPNHTPAFASSFEESTTASPSA